MPRRDRVGDEAAPPTTAEAPSELLERIGDPDAVAAQAQELSEHRRTLFGKHHELRTTLIRDELEREPAWLLNALGAEPDPGSRLDRWERTARELAGYRLDHDITDPEHALGVNVATDAPARAAQRSLFDTRAALGLDPPAPGRDSGLGYGE